MTVERRCCHKHMHIACFYGQTPSNRWIDRACCLGINVCILYEKIHVFSLFWQIKLNLHHEYITMSKQIHAPVYSSTCHLFDEKTTASLHVWLYSVPMARSRSTGFLACIIIELMPQFALSCIVNHQTVDTFSIALFLLEHASYLF